MARNRTVDEASAELVSLLEAARTLSQCIVVADESFD